jgi:hypothetical protein
MIPEFDEHGNLPPGIHHATWTEIVIRYAASTRRRDLLDGLLDALRSLKAAGCGAAYLDGSFVTAEAHPGDVDACWESANVVLDRLDPELQEFGDKCAAQKARYGGEPIPPIGQSRLTAQPFVTSSNATASPSSPRASSPST